MTKLKEYLKESPKTFAFWITPKGETIGSMKSHISMVVANPKKFGLTDDYIKETYKKYEEKVGFEGKAREEIMKKLIDEGFIRIRKYGNYGWVIDVNRLMKKIKERITKWAEKITEKGIAGIKETSKFNSVKILDNTGTSKRMTINELSAGKLIFESATEDLIECKTVNDLSDYKLII